MSNTASNRQSDAPTSSDWAELVEMHRDKNARIRAVEAGYKHITEQTADIRATLRDQDRRIGENAAQLQSIGEDVGATKRLANEQLSMLQDVKDAVTTATVLSRAGKYVAGLILTCSAVWLALKDFINWGKP